MSDKSEEEKKAFVPRITQLDAAEFDKEIHNVLSGQLLEVGKYLRPGALNCVRSEINLLLDLLIFHYSVITKNATFGQELLSLKYNDSLSKKQAAIYAFLNYVLPYLKNKYENHSSVIQNNRIRKTIDRFEVFVKIVNLTNSLFFLREGKYPSIVDRFLKLQYSPVNKLNRVVGYNYMTRELLWHGFMELLMYVLPLINYKAIKRYIKKPFLARESQVKYEKKIIYDINTKCVVCDEFPTLPCQLSIYCPHLVCYYCLKSNVLADEKFICPVCAETNMVNDHLKLLVGC